MLSACKHNPIPFHEIVLIPGQRPDSVHTSIISPPVQRTVRSSVDKWHLGHGRTCPRSLYPVATCDHVLSLGMSPVQKRWRSGTQATTIYRLLESRAAAPPMDMLVTLVRDFRGYSILILS